MGIKNPGWVDWPNHKYARDIEDLYKVGRRCDAWREFFRSETIEKLKKIKGYILWFNRYSYFERLICEFDCSEKKLRMTIESLMRTGHETPVTFVRKDIYDARAWADLPLNCFAEIDGCNERSGEVLWQHHEILKNEMPIIQFGIRKRWVVSRDLFVLTHRLKYGERFATMTFSHPQLDPRFENKRWVAEKTFHKEASRKEMTEALFAEVEQECTKYLVKIK